MKYPSDDEIVDRNIDLQVYGMFGAYALVWFLVGFVTAILVFL